MLLINSRLGINAKWLKGDLNDIADMISRVKKTNLLNDHAFFDYADLKQKYPELKSCRVFLPAPELLSTLWQIVLTVGGPGIIDFEKKSLQI